MIYFWMRVGVSGKYHSQAVNMSHGLDLFRYTFKTLGAGFWALQQNDFRKALTQITFEAGDADTNGAVAGALLGAKLVSNSAV